VLYTDGIKDRRMKHILQSRHFFLLILMIIIVVCASLVYRVFTVGSAYANRLQQASRTSGVTRALAATAQPAATLPPAPGMCHLKGRMFQMGIAFPEWSPAGYGAGDQQWLSELPRMRAQTSACWVEMPVLFHQTSFNATVVTTGTGTPSLSSFRYGIRFAHAEGLHVFVTFLLQSGGSNSWAGAIQFTTYTQEQAWFTSYWQTIRPYLQVAQQEGTEQLALGTEEEWLQENAPADLWNTLITSVSSVYSGTLTYDINWTSLAMNIPTWMHNSALKMIGVSAYVPLVDTAERVDPQRISSLWAAMVRQQLDTFALELGEPVFISEIGYRDSSDALYQPWVTQTSAPTDPVEQAAACSAVLANVFSDKSILGSFFWGWDNVGAFRLKDSQAASAIRIQYQSFQA
jgi:hypothetical protein